MRLAVAAIVKNEFDGLLEWIAFHRVVGVSHFVIADNGSDDGTRAVLAGLARLGVATLLDFPTIGAEKPQLPAYAAILRKCPRDIDLLAFIDADEFMLPMDGAETLLPLMEKVFAGDDVSALALNWAIFGSGGQLFAEQGLVIERFTRRAKQSFGVNHHYKSVVRPQCVVGFENPHQAMLLRGRYVDALGRDLRDHPKHGGGLSAEVVWSGARVNHYAVKSLEEFVVGKSRKGSATQHGRIKHKAYFVGHDRNEEECALASALAPKVKHEMERLEARLEPLLKPGKWLWAGAVLSRASEWVRQVRRRIA
jgi:hypothetical protein